MKLITVSGPPSTGKTSVIIKTIDHLSQKEIKVGVIKFDCLSTNDDILYKRKKIAVQVGISGGLCPDHFFVSNIEECFEWGLKEELDILISESAGLCNRCSPYLRGSLAVCIIDNLMGIHTPKKIGPMLRYADIVVITKGDIVSQAEREIFAYRVKEVNSKAKILFINGITGQGTLHLADLFMKEGERENLKDSKLRFTMPAALCSYCLGEMTVGKDYQIGNIKNINL
ncbi:Ni2+-binding GTPase involved in maturation of urease and hydrogenase [Orenia metallireducens]|uniref:Ni2+-binding GTPase involved in regulation of expression and maturation of urease and hydrogenase n=1 Tax=Orenia metallireducens TaxID=1413210 RepID=A0A285GG26_9FIRM|nr:GTP-binding protein [Orenia metallireducens]PRX30413.1 Ni2+-binding GTPase involved in maturation of urease and hydrogenase [Orenia metallireducens]SNY22378.1 Ni2+-binding GTPase involved in regulation of expression and maturation of urease and hydrogenase [Orenia metallireducens]